MKVILILFFMLLSPFAWCQKSECVRSKDFNRDQILQMRQFKGTSTIVAVSFDYKTVNTPSELIEYDGVYPVKTNGFKELKKLSKDEEYAILDILVNYDVDTTKSVNPLEAEGACYQPRNALLFYGRYGQVIGYFEVCFSCHSHKFDPSKESLSRFCDGKTDMIRAWMKGVGVTYGVNGEID